MDLQYHLTMKKYVLIARGDCNKMDFVKSRIFAALRAPDCLNCTFSVTTVNYT